MQRTRAGGDTRLHDRWSIGVGGHLNPATSACMAGWPASGARSSSRTSSPTYRFVGLLNDDTTEVGQVHLGVVFVADAGGRPVAVRETDKLPGGFATAGEVRAVRDGLETWSRLVFDLLDTAGTAA